MQKHYVKYTIFGLNIFITILSLLVMIGWFLHIPLLIQIFPTFIPMQFNTALCFLLSSIAVLIILLDIQIISFIANLIVLTIAGLTCIEYLFTINIGIDELFFRHYITTETVYPGRMAPNTAFCFLLSSFAIAILSFKTSYKTYWLSACVSTSTFSIAIVSFLGYVFNLPEAYGWIFLTGMALHTSIAFICMSIAIFLTSVSYDNQGNISAWALIPLTISCYIIAFNIWRSLEALRIRVYFEGLPLEYNAFFLSILMFFFLLSGIFLTKKSIDIVEEIVTARKTIERQYQEKKKLLHYIGHEVKNPLTVILNFSEMFQNYDKDNKIKEAFQSIYSSGNSLLQVINDLLMSAKYEAGELQLNIETVIFEDWFSFLASILEMQARRKEVNFTAKITPNHVPQSFLADQHKMKQIVQNIFKNALKHVTKNGHIELRVYFDPAIDHKQTIHIDIKDDGEGIPIEKQPEIFKPFSQGSAKEDKVGYGLGLSICKNLAEMMNGSVSFISVPNQETTFSVTLVIELPNTNSSSRELKS